MLGRQLTDVPQRVLAAKTDGTEMSEPVNGKRNKGSECVRVVLLTMCRQVFACFYFVAPGSGCNQDDVPTRAFGHDNFCISYLPPYDTTTASAITLTQNASDA